MRQLKRESCVWKVWGSNACKYMNVAVARVVGECAFEFLFNFPISYRGGNNYSSADCIQSYDGSPPIFLTEINASSHCTAQVQKADMQSVTTFLAEKGWQWCRNEVSSEGDGFCECFDG